MKNLIYLNFEGYRHVQPNKETWQLNNEFYCEMYDHELSEYLDDHNLDIKNGKLLCKESHVKYGLVLERK